MACFVVSTSEVFLTFCLFKKKKKKCIYAEIWIQGLMHTAKQKPHIFIDLPHAVLGFKAHRKRKRKKKKRKKKKTSIYLTPYVQGGFLCF